MRTPRYLVTSWWLLDYIAAKNRKFSIILNFIKKRITWIVIWVLWAAQPLIKQVCSFWKAFSLPVFLSKNSKILIWSLILYFFIEFIEVTSVNKIIRISSIQFNVTSYVCRNKSKGSQIYSEGRKFNFGRWTGL